MFNNVYLDSWAIADNTAILNVAIIGIAAALGAIAVIINAIRGIAVYKMAKKEGFSLAFLSFIPFAQSFVLGILADGFNRKNAGRKSINCVILPITTIAKWVAYIVFSLNISNYVKDFALLCKDYPDWIPIAKGFEALGSYVVPFVIVLGVFAVLSLVNHIFFNITLYRVFTEYKPVTAAVMTALSVMFGGIMSLAMLFVASKKDKNASNIYANSNQKEKAYF